MLTVSDQSKFFKLVWYDKTEVRAFVCVCVCVCALLRVRERGERRSILVFLIYPTTVYCQSCFLKYVFVQRNQILLKIKLRSPSSFTVWAHSSHNNYERERGLKICEYFTLKPPRGERSHMETLCECEYKESAGKSKKFSQFSGLCKRAQYQDIECVCV